VGIRDLASLIATIIMTPVVLMCSELIPKAVFLQKADTISLYIVKPIEVSLIVLYPLVKIASFFTRFLVKILGGKERQREAFVNRYEIELLLKEGQKQGILRKEEHRMIEQVFTFGETEVQSVMVPLVQVVMMEAGKTVKDILPVFEEYRFSQIPIYEERVDNIIGVVYINNLLDVPEETLVKDVAEEVLITPENKSIEELLSEMRIENKNFAVAVDEYGGVSGILTVEDIIEEIVGDIPDEDEQVEDIIRKDEGYILTGRARIDDLEEKLLVNLPEGDYNTISGMITTFLGRIPNPGEKFSHENIRFEILESTDRFVEKVKIMIGKNKKKKL
jgi:putative hemolysin